MKLEPAKNKILISSLNLGTFVYDNSISNGADTINAFVFKQIPEFRDDATLQLGSNIYLWLTIDSGKLKVDTTRVVLDTIPPVATQDKQSN